MIIDNLTFKSGDQVIYRGYVATYEGDELGTFALAHEDNFESVISFPSSLEEIFDHVDEECGDPTMIVFDDQYELVIF